MHNCLVKTGKDDNNDESRHKKRAGKARRITSLKQPAP